MRCFALLALVLAAGACGGSSVAPGDGGPADAAPPRDGAAATDGGADAAVADAGADAACPAPVASAPAVLLADFEDGVIPSSDTLTTGFRGADVARGTIVHPG
ncbi:MAG TPA: hypothetical protein VGQ83_20325, partial [Polyangia bacterium]